MGDNDLVERAQGGDTRSFDRLVERHQPRIYATLVRIVGNPDTALDLTQDTFIRAWRRIGAFEGRSAFSTWLYRISVRLAYDEIDRQRRHGAEELDDRLPADGADTDAGVEAAAVAEELRGRIDTLPRMQRTIVVMRTYDDMPYKQIAEVLDTTENSARVSFHHAITRLREGYRQEARTR